MSTDRKRNIVIELEAEYLGAEAKARGVSRTRLVQVLMETIVSQHLVGDVLKDIVVAKPRAEHYRRFKPSKTQ
jgi:hypothetical protein